MKKSIFIGLTAGCMILVAAVACKKNANPGFDARGTSAGPFVATVVLPTVIAADRTLTSDTLYILDGKTYVDSGVTLTINAGGRVEGRNRKVGNNNDSASALIITRGAKLFAEGTETEPIVFTSHESSPASGDWGGIVLLGKAPLNRADTTIEGIQLPTVPVGIDVNYGGGGQGLGDSSDCSGRLTYLIIEYAGAIISPDNELNALTCGGVGAGTVLDYIESYYGNDDAFEFFGGTVNATHLFALAPDDDAFDFDFGYRGKIQFAVSVLKNTETYSANPNGIESDNNATGADLQPYTQAVISNMTVIGLADSTEAANKALLNGAYFRRKSSYLLRNSIVMGFPVGVRIDDGKGATSLISNNLVQAFNDVDVNFTLAGSNNTYRSFAANTDIKLHAPFAATPDFRPDATSPALSLTLDYSSLPSTPIVGCTFSSWIFETTSYAGAFEGYDGGAGFNWLAGWARF